MNEAVSIITPAYGAEALLPRAVRSVLSQSVSHWEMLIVADDGADYEAVLAAEGISDPRLRFFATAETRSGASTARNVALDHARYRFAAQLDADDLFHPKKLEMALETLPAAGIVSTALQLAAPDLTPLRTIGAGPDRLLSAGHYKFTNLSMDSMLVYDRQLADPRYDESFPHLTDIEFLLKLFAFSPGCFHLGTPLHTYVKEPQSMSNAPGASARLIATKKRLTGLLAAGHYPLADPGGVPGLLEFYRVSEAAEAAYLDLFEANPAFLFEDHLESFLAAEGLLAQ